MGRRKGARNADFEVARAALVTKLTARLMGPAAARASLRGLAEAAGVSLPTLQHYFGDRTGVLVAVFESAHRGAGPYLTEVAEGTLPSLRVSVEWFLRYVLDGLVTHGVAQLHELGLTTGARDDVVGPAYLAHILEPSLVALERRLERHRAAGHLQPCNLRMAALALLSPVLLAVLHQHSLGGCAMRPLDLDELVTVHAAAFVRAYGPARAPRRRRRIRTS
jgi:AcrR family transcriptional regulator